jgi:hypothetical protein
LRESRYCCPRSGKEGKTNKPWVISVAQLTADLSSHRGA